MRPLWKDVLIALFFGMILPGMLTNGMVLYVRKNAAQASEETVPRSVPVYSVLLHTPEGTEKLELEQYIPGVVLAEMPASFEPEALKAQAVAARTYTRKASLTGGKHGDGGVCTDPACCQGYLTAEAYLAKGGTQESVDKVFHAVQETAGLVLTYEGELIEATYFSCSGGMTEDAVAVWGTAYPYLRSVSSPGEEQAAGYTQTLEFTPEEFSAALGRQLPGSPESWFSITTYTEGGGVAVMTICGRSYTGVQLRQLLGLRSTAFAVQAHTDSISITTKGYGHRVGMSQYGADAMATSGSTFDQILAHYYPGTALSELNTEAPA